MTAQESTNELDKLEQPHMVLVEGTVDQAIVLAMIKHESLDDFHVHNMKGKDNWRGKIKAIARATGFRRVVTSLGLLRDADTNGQNQFQSCASALTAAGLPTPTRPGELAEGRPAVAIEIVPSIDSTGAVEELCLPSFNIGRRECADRYFECLGGVGAQYETKAYVQAYLAGFRPHHNDLRVAADRDALDLRHETFDGLRRFLRELHSI